MKPYIVCHMMESVDGRIACDMVDKISGDEYYTALESLECPTTVEGKVTLQIHVTGFEPYVSQDAAPVGREEFYVAERADGYEVAVDSAGTLLWSRENCGGSKPRLCLLSERATREYLGHLRSLGISYIATGKERVDLCRAVELMNEHFGVQRMAIVGGGKIDGGFLAAGLLDEISVMIAPGIDGRSGQPALFDGIADKEGFLPFSLRYKESKVLENGVIWVRYLPVK
ncbi:MAG: dihydrofolate reductase family protein [Bacteroidaceae bacterium]|jgi:2,5-diamino-6-(ribosylamino)-4(3H)-pyrimidinone 5'-phosphate reductase